MTAVIEVEHLSKTYVVPFKRTKVEAVSDLSFSVNEGEIFGLIGPNGAGKTTTIRMLMGLISPTAGRAKIFGHVIPAREARSQLGFLPETPYFYDYLSVAELLDLAGRLCGVDKATRKQRSAELIELVGLGHAGKKQLKKFSKGMLQRAGIAQALIHDPKLIVFDEPMGGLDPVGRKEVRDIIFSLREQGKTVFFSSHILADVEMICDRVAIVHKGKLREVEDIRELVSEKVTGMEVVLRDKQGADRQQVLDLVDGDAAVEVRHARNEIHLRLPPKYDVDGLLGKALAAGLQVAAVTARHETLEEHFIRQTQGKPQPEADDEDVGEHASDDDDRDASAGEDAGGDDTEGDAS